MRSITKTDDSSPIRANIVVEDPSFVLIIRTLVMCRLCLLVERVCDAFFEDFICVFWPRGALWTWFSVGQSEIPEESTEIIRMVLYTELFVQELMNFLCFPGLPLPEKF